MKNSFVKKLFKNINDEPKAPEIHYYNTVTNTYIDGDSTFLVMPEPGETLKISINLHSGLIVGIKIREDSSSEWKKFGHISETGEYTVELVSFTNCGAYYINIFGVTAGLSYTVYSSK